jgi:hypothetical protein
MEYQALLVELAEKLIEEMSIKFSTHGILSINGDRITLKEFPSFMMNYCKSENTRKYLPILLDAPSPSHALESLKVELKRLQSTYKSLIYKDGSSNLRGYSYDGCVPFISVTNSKKVLFYNKATKSIEQNLDYDTYCKTTDKEYQIKPMPCVIEFNPYRPEQIYTSDYNFKTCTHLNTYKKPDWQFARKLTNEEAKQYSKLPSIIDDFFTHLFPEERCKKFVFDWLHFALTSRCETYLVMNGAKGIGKNVLSETICSALIGKENHKLANVGALEGNFNSILAESRMIVFDEFKISNDEEINRLKRYANAEQTIERKGIDVNKTEVTYNSYIICNNSLTDMRIAWDDRRFSVMDLTDKKLDDVWDSKKIDELINTFRDPENPIVREFGYWLLYREPEIMVNPFSCYKGTHFYKLCYTSMPEWAKMIIDEVTTSGKGYFEESDLKLMYKDRTNGVHRFPLLSKVDDFLKNYKHNGVDYLGHIEKDSRTYYLQASIYFNKEKLK